MKRLISISAVLLLTLLLAGCLPEERFWWSPDGSRALVRIEDGLHLAGVDGTPGPKLALELGGEGDMPVRGSWVVDGSGFVINRVLRFATWQEAKPMLPPGEIAEVERLARSIPDLIHAWTKSAKASLDKADGGIMEWLPMKDRDVLAAAFFVAYAENREGLEADLRSAPKGEEVLRDLHKEEHPFRVHEICHVKLRDGAVEGDPRSLARSLRALLFPKVSPRHSTVAFFRAMSDGETAALLVAALDGSATLEVAQGISVCHEWTRDGKSLLFAAPVMGEASTPLQRIQRVEVLREDGGLLAPRSSDDGAGRLKEPKSLAIALMVGTPRLVALPDGSVLFASQPASFPAPGEGLEVAPLLHVVSEDGASVRAVPTAPGDLPANLGYFAVSPDGKLVAIVESDTDAVAVVELTSGRTEMVSPAHPGWQCRTLPCWRNAEELTFAALDGGVPKWMLWKKGTGVRSISPAWAKESTSGWLEEKKPEPAASANPSTP